MYFYEVVVREIQNLEFPMLSFRVSIFVYSIA